MRLNGKGQQSHRMAVLLAIFVLMTALIFYSSNSSEGLYSPFHAVTNNFVKSTNLKKWSGKDGYIPLYRNKSFTLRCQSCALVTSSSHVLGSGAGNEINRSECVIRMNDAPTIGYESDVGNRTTLRVVAHASVFRVVRRPNEFLHQTDNNSTIIFWGPPNKIGKDAKGTLYRLIQRVSMTYSNLSFFTITPSKMRKFDNLFQRETGRDRTKPGSKKVPYHYYKPRGPDECLMYTQNEGGRRGNHHRFITEKQVFRRWAKQYNISFTHPEW
ncbi:alpha-N-acetylgalactosaminide alpha-2,6-sialyltransferase 6 isoform X2 [Nothobranchius furzeri]|uniref:alpha-N-acetylgalactosaminide alpha-2,6-sialyltransferase 6 isoform X2 n=1 Tax=Nothobranchius furzeri TaxID=105023 RepID=UPI0039049A69